MIQTCGIPPLSNPDKPEDYDSYRYVVKLPMDKVTKEEIDILDRDVATKKAEMKVLETATPASMWLSDLEDFTEAWKLYKEVREEEMKGEGGDVAGAKKGKKAAAKTTVKIVRKAKA